MRRLVSERPLFCVCSAASAAAFCCSFTNSRGAFSLCLMFVSAALFVLPLGFRRKPVALSALLMCAVMSLSFSLYYGAMYEPALGFAEKTVTAECTVIGEPAKSSAGTDCVDVRCTSVTQNGVTSPTRFNVRVYFSDMPALVPSSEFTATLAFFSAEDNDRFDKKAVHFRAYSTSAQITLDKNERSFRYFCYRVRNAVKSRLLCKNPAVLAFLKGMLFGDTGQMSGVFKNKIAGIGMSHIMAVSGMHLLFAIMFTDFILLMLHVGYKPRCITAVVSAFLFTFISGFSVSCIRAGIMVILMYSGRLFNRESDTLTSLSLAAFLILVFSPYNIRCESFLLSASACLGIVLLSPVIRGLIKLRVKNGAFRFFLYSAVSIAAMSLSANIACLPVFVIMFGRVNLLGVVSNILLIVPVQVMFYLGFALLIVSPVPAAAAAVDAVISWVYGYIERVVNFLYSLPYTTVNDGYFLFYPIFFMFAVLVAGVVLYRLRFKARRVYPYVLSFAAVCVLLFGVNVIVNRDSLRADFADVGQGSCTVFTKDEHAVIVDCGGSDRNELMRALKNSNTRRIELLALTHTDFDHISYLNYLVNNYEIERIVYPEFSDGEPVAAALLAARAGGTNVTALDDDAEFDVLGGAKLSAFVKLAYKSKLVDNTSALYKLDFHGSSIACTGDMNVHQEYVYLDYGDKLDCDILLVPHHGSGSSSLGYILDLYSADYAVISVGKDNKYGLPDSRALYRLEKHSKILRTDELSTVSFILNKKGYRLLNKL